MFKRYDDAKHWGLFIPVGRKVLVKPWDPANDDLRPLAVYRMHLCITVKLFRVSEMRFSEIRVRIGFQYL
jgi:hypothetical protein